LKRVPVNDLSRLLWFRTMAGNLGVHRIRRQIDLTGPRDRAVINEDLLEKLHV
jgi:hypothetical protein